MFYDAGLSTDYNSNWGDDSGTISIQRDTSGTTLSIPSGATWKQLYARSSSTFFPNPFCVELDVVSYSDTPQLRFNNGSVNKAHNLINVGHYEFLIDTDTVTVLLNGVVQQNWLDGIQGTNCKVFFEFSTDTDVLKYKNFKIYPII